MTAGYMDATLTRMRANGVEILGNDVERLFPQTVFKGDLVILNANAVSV